MDDPHPVGNSLGVFQYMRAEENGFARAFQVDDNIVELEAPDWVESPERFIKDQKLRVVDKGLRQANPLEHSAGKALERFAPPVRQPNQIKQPLRSLFANSDRKPKDSTEVIE